MALSLDTVFEVRSTGNDNNGGGFTTGAAGTDRSLQDASHATLSASSVVNSTTTIIDVAGGDYTCTDADVGNLLQIHGGTATAGHYRITARASQQWTLDRSAGTAAQTVVGDMGGAFATIQPAFTQMAVAGMTCYIKATATYSISTGLTQGGASSSSVRTRVYGYTTTRADRGQITILATAAIDMFTTGSRFWSFANVIFDGDSTATKGVVLSSGSELILSNFIIRDCLNEGLDVNGTYNSCHNGEVSGCGGTNGAIDSNTRNTTFREIWSHDNSKTGFFCNTNSETCFIRCRSTNNTGNGFHFAYYLTQFEGCVSYGNSGDGIYKTSNSTIIGSIKNNIIDSNGGYGINFAGSVNVEDYFGDVDHNAFRNNTSGHRNNINASLNDVTLTGSPFTNAGADDYSLNNVAGAGAACRAVGTPPPLDIGYLQHVDTVGVAATGLVPLISEIEYPPFFKVSGAVAAARTGAVLDTDGDTQAVIIQVGDRDDGKTITKLAIVVQAVGTAGLVDARVETVSTTDGNPTGTLATTNSNLSQTVSATGWNEFTLTAEHVVAAGDILAISFVLGATASASITTQESRRAHNSSQSQFPYGAELIDPAGWIKLEFSTIAQPFSHAVGFSDGTWMFNKGIVPVVSFSNISISNVGSAEAGLEFQLPFPATLAGVVAQVDHDGDIDIHVGNASYIPGATGATRLATMSHDKDIRDAVIQESSLFRLVTPVDLAANTTYRLVIESTTATAVNIRNQTFNEAANVETMGYSTAFKQIVDDDDGGWATSTATLPLMHLVLSKLNNGAGGPVAQSRIIQNIGTY